MVCYRKNIFDGNHVENILKIYKVFLKWFLAPPLPIPGKVKKIRRGKNQSKTTLWGDFHVY